MRVLVVEDETMVSILVEDMLSDLGHTVIGPASCVAEALALIAEKPFDFALLDINLGGEEKAFPIADLLDQKGVPYALVSGYDPRGIEGYDHATKLQKPFSLTSFSGTVKELTGRVVV